MLTVDDLIEERRRLQNLKEHINAVCTHASTALWRQKLLNIDLPLLVNEDALGVLQVIGWQMCMTWTFFKEEDENEDELFIHRPRWSCTKLTEEWRLEHIAVLVGVFPSISQARKNGWTGEIPNGFEKERVGLGRLHKIKVF